MTAGCALYIDALKIFDYFSILILGVFPLLQMAHIVVSPSIGR